MEFSPVGHILLYGQTYSGKTYFSKHLIEKLNVNKVYVFTATPKEWATSDFSTTVFTEDFNINALQIAKDCQIETDKNDRFKCIVVFDDFNDKINTITDTQYKELFTRGRHYGVRIINLAHTTKAVGPTARSNCKYVCYMSTLADDELKVISDSFFDRNHMRLKKITDDARDENSYNCMMIDRTARKVYYEKAPIKVKINVDLPDNASLVQDPAGALYQGIASQSTGMTGHAMSTNFGNKSAYNMVDNSNNNFQVSYDIKQKQLVQQNNTNNELKKVNYIFDRKMNRDKESDEVKSLIRKQFRTNDDKKRILLDINNRLRPNIPYTMQEKDFNDGMRDYMKEIHNEKINKLSKNTRVLTNAIDVYSADDTISKINSGYNFATSAFDFFHSKESSNSWF